MISTLEKEITLRFLKARKKDGFLNVISIFSFIGIGLGVAVLIIVMSVMNGFRTELINKIVGFNAHIVVKPYEKKYINPARFNYPQLNSISKNLISSNSGEAIIIQKDVSKGIVLRGYSQSDFSKLKIIKDDSFVGNRNNLTKNYISIGKELSFTLGLNIGDDVTIMSSSGIETIIGSLPKKKTFTVISLFESGLTDFDNNIAFINLDTLDEFFNLTNNDRILEIYLKNPQNIENQKFIVQKIFPDEFVYSWADTNSSLFSALKVERNVMFIILSLIILVASLNIISGLIIFVKEKNKDIGILKTIGMSNNSIVKIFFTIGISIGLIGSLLGLLIGIIFSINIQAIQKILEGLLNTKLFSEEVYYLSSLPSKISINEIILVLITAIFISILSTIFPAMRSAKVDPIKSIRSE